MSGGRLGQDRPDGDFSGIWTFAEVAERKLAGTWPVAQLLDSFDTDTTSLYTQYADTAGTWAVSAGELVASGGSQTVFIRNGTSYANAVAEVDCNYSNEGGLILRFQDVNNYYQCVVEDDSSSFPSQNLAIFKRQSGTFTKLGTDINISWSRGTSKTIRFQVQGALLTAYVDGALVSAVTDTSFTGAGGGGMRKQGSDSSKYQAFRWYAFS